jgi:hypothetical protein
MYDKLIAAEPLLNDLRATLRAPGAARHVAQITEALDDAARAVGEVSRTPLPEDHRAALQKVYRGMIAARRLVVNLHELQQD